MDAHEIIPGLWLGNKKASMNKEFLRKNKITTVFNCTKDLPFEPSVKRSYRVPVDDNLEPVEIGNLEKWAPEIVYKVIGEYNAGRSILIHCFAGMQRSAAVVAMTLIAMYQVPADKVMKFIRDKRNVAFFPQANFDKAIRGFDGRFREAWRS